MAAFIISAITSFVNLFHYLRDKAFASPLMDKLLVIDMRNLWPYSVSIHHNAVRATDFQKIAPVRIGASYHERVAKGLVLLDPGFKTTAACESHIVYIDGDRGTLQYRQYPIGDLFTQHDYEETVHLLIFGHLPSKEEKLYMRSQVAKQMVPHQSVINVIKAFSRDAPAYLVIAAGLSACAASKPDNIPVHRGESIYDKDGKAVDDGVYRALAAFTTVVALTYCHQKGKPLPSSSTKVDQTLSSIENMLIMMKRVDHHGAPEKRDVYVLNKLWILFADHEMTNSTAAFLTSTSSLSDPISACAAAVSSGNGPLHVGAIDITYKMFQKMGNVDGVRRHMADVRAKKCRLMGVGHRVYRTVDPRVPHIRSVMTELGAGQAAQNPMLEVALEIESTVRTDTYFTSRNLNINADLYSSFVYAALDFDPSIFTGLTMTARCAGLLAHWRESMS